MGFSDILSDAVKGIPLAEVLRERLALADQQFAALDRELAKLKLEKEHLELENRGLRSQLQQRAAQIHALEVAAQQKRTGDRPDTQQQMLILLSKHERTELNQIARHFQLSKEAARFHLTELDDAKFVTNTFNMDADVFYYLTQDGRRYLATRGLL